MNKISTTIEQSKKLLELGIDVNTADMHWMNEILFLSFDKVDKAFNDKMGCEYLPAWSLASLLSVIPKHIKNYNVLRIDISDNDFAIWYDEIGYGVNNDLPNITMESAVDACYEMICRLKEKNLL